MVDIDPDSVNESSGSMFDRYKEESGEWKTFQEVIDRIWSRQPQSSLEMVEFQAHVMTKSADGGGWILKRDRNFIYEYGYKKREDN